MGHKRRRLKNNIMNGFVIKTKKMFILTAVLISLVLPSFASGAEQKPQEKIQQKQPEAQQPKFNIGDFTYSATNRRDPFESMFHSKLQRSKQSRTFKTVKEGYELEELKLVGILRAGEARVAMMEDMQGRGMLFRKGDYLNKNLWIVDILEGHIVLGYKLKGEIRTFTLDIPRKKEGM